MQMSRREKTLVTLAVLTCVLVATLDGATDDVFYPNDGDVEVVQSFGGNYKFVEEDDVLILTRDNFHYFVLSRSLVLVQFYAPWCGHCKEMAAEYSSAAQVMAKENVTLAKVDATKEVELAKEFLVTGYPTVVLLRNGRKEDTYQGKRTSRAIVEYLREKADPNWTRPESAVMQLTSDNFTKTVSSSDLMLVQFYASYCVHCKQLAPEFESAAETLRQYGIPLAKVDGPSEKQLCDRLAIKGWPTLKVFRKGGRASDYKGPRDEQGIVQHMRQLKKPASQLVTSVGQLRSLMQRTEATVVGFFSPADSTGSAACAFYQEYMAAAQEMFDVGLTLAHTFDEQLMEHYDVKAGTVAVLQPASFHSVHEPARHLLTRVSASSADIVDFVRFASVPLVGQRTKRNEAFKYATKPLVVVYFDVNFELYNGDTQLVREKVLAVAADYKLTNVKFCLSDESEYSGELKDLNLAESDEDVKVVAFGATDKFRMEPSDGEFSSETLSTFIKQLTSGKRAAYYKSQLAPRNQQGPVRVVVADTFIQEVVKVEKDVLILFYAPWCGHCKAMEPEYRKLAKYMAKHNENLVVAKMDATANDVHPMFGQLQGYPTLFFVPFTGKQEPVQYTGGEMSFKALKKFVGHYSSVFLTAEERMGLAPAEELEQLRVSDEL